MVRAVTNEASWRARCNGDVKLWATLSSTAGYPSGVTDTRDDTSMPSSDKDRLRGRYCKPEKRRYQRRAIPISRRSATKSLFLAEGQLCAFMPNEE